MEQLRNQLRQLQTALQEHPEQRGEILLEIAEVHAELGDLDRAVAIWRDLIAEETEDGDYARVQLANAMFHSGRDDEARAELATFKATRRTDGGAWQIAAELFETRGELPEAANWFTMSVSRFSDDERAALDQEFGWTTNPARIVRGRRRVREALGLPPDDFDQLVPTEKEIQSIFRRPMASMDEAVERLREGTPAELRMLYWPRTQFEPARSRWPGTIDDDVDESIYYRNLEAKLATAAAAGTTRISVVPCTVDNLAAHLDRTGDHPADSASRREFLNLRYAEGHYLTWPPPRNQPCWCGSETKYKKCCGAPGR